MGYIASLDELSDTFKKIFSDIKAGTPSWSGIPLTAAESVELQMKVIHKVGPTDSGAFLSHFGNKQWL